MMVKLKIFLFFFVVTGSQIAFSMERNPGSSSCSVVESIAKDESRIGYIKGWIEQSISNQELLELMGWLGRVRSLDNPEKMSQLKIDWSFLGLNPRLSFVALNRDYDDRESYTNPNNIKSISFGEGRNSVIIKIGSSEGLGLNEHALERIKQIGPDVYVFCEKYSGTSTNY